MRRPLSVNVEVGITSRPRAFGEAFGSECERGALSPVFILLFPAGCIHLLKMIWAILLGDGSMAFLGERAHVVADNFFRVSHYFSSISSHSLALMACLACRTL